ncbi:MULTISPECIES: anthranilate synthase component I [Pontibacillus]|uniref:Anthranilate synthase component 1 n=1 Tax=Pontibacillus chungwhensis TaxID=265426 RepID=A0ABY8V071_9BACI|nr:MULTISPECIES: anthranilate synthase component I [Pontibacillus]MCD5325512.1 anthranilate synthase component I [Pontibacillus sp. HN14]WIF98622.1 anthranilate synthase component I [Pontibacillus chungwhensis]
MKELLQFLQESSTHKTVPVTYQCYSDTVTPIQMYERLREEAVYLLESGDHTSSWSRYSFIGLHPFITMTEHNGLISFYDEDRQETTEASSLRDGFDQIFDRLQVKLPDVPLPFHGGGVGFVSYDAISDMEKIKEPRFDDLNMPHYHFLFCRTLLAYDHQSNELTLVRFVRNDGEDDENTLRHKYDQAVSEVNQLLSKLSSTHEAQPFLAFHKGKNASSLEGVETNYEKEQFKEDVEKIKEYIRAGDIFQSVLSQRFSKKVTVDGLQLYRVLRHVNPSPYMFYINYHDYELIGSSPERLIQVADDEIEIHPIAGTRKRGESEEEDDQLAQELLQDEKEKAEHYMLVDLARNDVGRVASFGTVETPVLAEIMKFSRVMHMISKVTGHLNPGTHPIEAFQSAFPAGTLSGAPKIRAMEILQETEPTARNVYGGGVVYFGFDGNLDSCIAIRTILLKDQVAHVQAGAGVVADSDPEKEWQETVNKASALLQTIDQAEELFGTTSHEEEKNYA